MTLSNVRCHVGNSTRTEIFARAFPARGFHVGIAESKRMRIALDAAAMLAKTGVQAHVINPGTVKPLDEDAIVKAAAGAGRFETEDDLIAGRPGSAIAADVARRKVVPVEFVNVGVTYVESGEPEGRFQKSCRVLFATKMSQFLICEQLRIDHPIEYEGNPVSLIPGFLLEQRPLVFPVLGTLLST